MKKIRVFISFKNKEAGAETPDTKLAAQLYECLTQKGIPTFYSNVTLLEKGESEYKDAIDNALDDATVLVVIGSCVEYLTSKWVKYEWSGFSEDILAGDKKDATIIPYLSNTIERMDKPRSLRNLETFSIEENTIDEVANFVHNYLISKGFLFEDDSVNKYNSGIDSHSKYSALSENEKKRLEIQCKLTRDSDLAAITYATKQFEQEETIYILDLGCAYGTTIGDRFTDYPQKNIYVLGVDRDCDIVEIARELYPDPRFHFENIEVESDSFPKNIRAYMETHQIPGFHLVISTVFLRHLKQPVKTMENVKNVLLDGGYFLIREQDDGNIISCGDHNLIENILEKHLSLKGSSDHYYGRKVYGDMLKAGYEEVRTFHRVRDTAGKTMEEKQEIFEMAFRQRKNYVDYLHKQNKKDKEIAGIADWMETAIERLQEIFKKDEFWYQELDLVFLGRKVS